MTPNDIQVVIPGIFYHVTLYSKKKKKKKKEDFVDVTELRILKWGDYSRWGEP